MNLTNQQSVCIHLRQSSYSMSTMKNNKPYAISNDQGNPSTPYAISYHENQILIGDSAYAFYSKNISNSVQNVFPLLGLSYQQLKQYKSNKNLRCRIVNIASSNQGAIQFQTSDDTVIVPIQQLMTLIFNRMHDNITFNLDKYITNAFIIINKQTNKAKIHSIQQSINKSKFKLIKILNNQQCIIQAYNKQLQLNSTNLLINFCKQNTTLILFRYKKYGQYQAQECLIDEIVSGNGIDNTLYQQCLGKILLETGNVLKGDRAERRLRMQVSTIKNQLFHSDNAEINVDEIVFVYDFNWKISKDEFNEKIAYVQDKLVHLIDRILDDGKASLEEIGKVILVGDCWKVKKLYHRLNQMFETKILDTISPQYVQVIGGTILSATCMKQNAGQTP